MVKRVRGAVLCLTLAGSVAWAEGARRDPAPERVTLFASAGALIPSGDFGDRVDSGPLFSVGAFYRLGDYVAPSIAAQYAFLEPSATEESRGSLDTYRILGGLRLFLLPARYPVRPWISGLVGWAHYDLSPRQPMEPVIGGHRDDRDDILLAPGGGVDVRLHPNFEIGLDVRHNASLTDDSDKGEGDLHAFSVLGAVMFNY